MTEVLGESPRVALLGRDDAVRAQLRVALSELGASLVYEGDLRSADASAVVAAQPAVVLLNLDAEGEDALDDLEALLLDPSMRVVFNEAETTAALSGWDLARWARHLAAKVLGHDRTIPPPPEGAEYLPNTDLMPSPGAPPSPASQADPLSMETLESEASASVDSLPAGSTPTGWRTHSADAASEVRAEDVADFAVDADAIASALSAAAGQPTDVLRTAPPDSKNVSREPMNGDASDEVALISIDVDELDAALAVIDAGDEYAAEDMSFSLQDMESTEDLERELEALSQSTVADEHAAIDLSEGVSDSIDVDGTSLSFSLDTDDALANDELDADVAAMAARLDALEQSPPRREMEVRDPDFFFELSESEPSASGTSVSNPPPVNKPAPRSGAGISLALADELAEMQASIPKAQPAAPSIDISYLSLEALPDPGLLMPVVKTKPVEDEAYLPRPGIDLMLAPLDAHLDESSKVPEAKSKHSAVEADLALDDDAGADAAAGHAFDLSALALEISDDRDEQSLTSSRIPRVLVLGASIGGPDALRTFLAGLPADFPALLVLAQHLESGFFDRLAQQLQKVSKLPVRVASADTPACAGEVVVIPSGVRIKISRDGHVRREPYEGPTHYRPCIDDVMHDMADAFGKRATAIIFSGMAGDAVEGAVYITSKGGEVWAQTPASCVVSSMVDGAQARGVVEFVGSPRELAEHCVARYGQVD